MAEVDPGEFSIIFLQLKYPNVQEFHVSRYKTETQNLGFCDYKHLQVFTSVTMQIFSFPILYQGTQPFPVTLQKLHS